MSIKKLLTFALAVLFIVAASIPVSAERSASFLQLSWFDGARVSREGMLNGNTNFSSISIVFWPSVEHYPESYYHLGMRVKSYALGGALINDSGFIRDNPTNLHCTYTFVWGAKKPISSGNYKFYLNPGYTEPSAPDYSHTLNQ